MRFSTTSIISSLALLSTASARIIGLEAPSTVAIGEPFTVSLLTENYVQSVSDVAAAFGISSGSGFPGELGRVLLSSSYLGANASNTIEKLNFTVSIPNDTFVVVDGPATLSGSVFSLYGASYAPTLVPFNVSVTVGDHTSTDTVNSTVYTQ